MTRKIGESGIACRRIPNFVVFWSYLFIGLRLEIDCSTEENTFQQARNVEIIKVFFRLFLLVISVRTRIAKTGSLRMLDETSRFVSWVCQGLLRHP